MAERSRKGAKPRCQEIKLLVAKRVFKRVVGMVKLACSLEPWLGSLFAENMGLSPLKPTNCQLPDLASGMAKLSHYLHRDMSIRHLFVLQT